MTNILAAVVVCIVTNWWEMPAPSDNMIYVTDGDWSQDYYVPAPAYRSGSVYSNTYLDFDWKGTPHRVEVESKQIAAVSQQGTRREGVEWGEIEVTPIIDITDCNDVMTNAVNSVTNITLQYQPNTVEWDFEADIRRIVNEALKQEDDE
jgi:hypothetical protein